MEHIFPKYTIDELDLINLLLFIIESQNEIKDILEIDYNDSAININPTNPIIMLDSNFHDLCAGMGLKELNIKYIEDLMNSIRKKDLEISFLSHPFIDGIYDKIYESKGSAIYSYLLSGKNNDYDKRVKIYFSSFLYNALNKENENYNMLDILYKLSEFKIVSKYSQVFYKYLYSIDKNTILISYKDLLDMFKFDIKNPIIDSFAKFKNNILNNVKKDLNNKSDIKFEFKKIKKNNNVYVEFIIDKSKFKKNNKKIDTVKYFNMAGEYYLHREINKKIKNKDIKASEKDKFIKKILNDKKAFSTFVYIAKIHFVLNNIKHLFPNEYDKIVVFPYLDKKFGEKNITIANNYRLFSLSSGKYLTNNATDTYFYLSEAMSGDIDKIDKPSLINNVYKNTQTSISWTDG